MLKKSLLTTAFLLTVLIVSGCNNAANNNANNETVDYIVTTVIPENARENVKDPTVGFVKINPNFNAGAIPDKKVKIKWFSNGLGSKIPGIDEGNILEVINTDKEFVAYVGNIDEKDFENYFGKLAANGYQFAKTNTSWESFDMSNDKYAVNLRFGQDGPNVTTIRAKILNAGNAAEQETNTEDTTADKE